MSESEMLKPSEGAREVLKSVLAMSDTSLEAAALELDVYAQQRERAAYERGKAEGLEEGKQAERGRICEALKSAQAKTAWEGSQEIADPDGLHPAYWDGADTAFDEAINIVNQE